MTTKKKIVISLGLVIIIITLIIYFIIIPTTNDIKKINQAVYAERVDLEKKYLRGQILRKAIEDFEKIKPEKDKLINVFIIKGKELEFITALEKIAAFNNLEQNLRLQTTKEKESGSYYVLPLEITAQGEFINILKYLKDLEKLNYYFNIFTLTFRTAKEKNLIIATLNGEIYALPPIEE